MTQATNNYKEITNTTNGTYSDNMIVGSPGSVFVA